MNASAPSFRKDIVGQRVTDAALDSDGVRVVFSTDWCVVIWSSAQFTVRGKLTPLSEISAIVGTKLISFDGSDTHEFLRFSGDLEVAVDLNDRADTQPEAMMLNGPNTLIVAWND